MPADFACAARFSIVAVGPVFALATPMRIRSTALLCALMLNCGGSVGENVPGDHAVAAPADADAGTKSPDGSVSMNSSDPAATHGTEISGTMPPMTSNGAASDASSSAVDQTSNVATDGLVPRANDGQCAPPTPYCNTDAGVCAMCLADQNCSGTTPYCSTSSHACVGCVDVINCSGDTGWCSPTTHSCVACLDDSHCSGGRYCSSNGECVQCLTDANCGDPAKTCNSANQCVP
jgi:hypothetical protein